MRSSAAAGSRVRLRALLHPVHDRLLFYVPLVGLAGFLVPSWAHALDGWVPVMLAGQVLGVALTLPARDFMPVVRRPIPVLVALLVQWTCLPLVGLLIVHLTGSDLAGRGAAIVTVVPAEITSPLIAILAGGTGALAIGAMAGSLTLGTVLTPLWVSVLLGAHSHVHVNQGALVSELALSVLVPLVVGVALRSRFPALGLGERSARSLDLAAVSVVLVVFVGAGAARPILGSGLGIAVEAVLLCAAVVVAGLSLGRLVGVVSGRSSEADARALLFPVAMREFGIATAVALAVAPRAAGIGGLYGVVLMMSAAAYAKFVRRR
jgi:BASS family bile acid:Na+ symporter